MATITFTWKAPTVREVRPFTVVADAATTYTLTTGNGKAVSVLGSVGTATQIAAALAAALEASTEGEFEELAGTSNTAVVTATGPEDGRPFTLTASVVGGAGTLTAGTVVNGSSPHDLNKAANYSAGALPVNGDVVVVENSDEPILWGLAGLTTVTFTLQRRDTHTGQIGLPPVNEDGGYPEYRARHLETAVTGATGLDIAVSSSDGPGQVRLRSTAASAVTLTVRGPGAGRGVGQEPVEVYGTPASSVVNSEGAGVAVAPLQGQTATVATLRALNSAVTVGSGVTLATINLVGSEAAINCSYTTLTLDRGSFARVFGAAAGTTTTSDDGTIDWQSTGSPGTITLGSGGGFDCANAPAGFAITSIATHENSVFNNPADRITRPYTWSLPRTELSRIFADIGTNQTLTVS